MPADIDIPADGHGIALYSPSKEHGAGECDDVAVHDGAGRDPHVTDMQQELRRGGPFRTCHKKRGAERQDGGKQTGDEARDDDVCAYS